MGDKREPVAWRVPSRAQRTIRAGGCVTGPAPMWSYPETDPKDPEAVALYAHPPETEALVEALRLDADMYANAVDEALAGWPVEKDDREMRAVQVALGELSGHLRALSQFGGTER